MITKCFRKMCWWSRWWNSILRIHILQDLISQPFFSFPKKRRPLSCNKPSWIRSTASRHSSSCLARRLGCSIKASFKACKFWIWFGCWFRTAATKGQRPEVDLLDHRQDLHHNPRAYENKDSSGSPPRKNEANLVYLHLIQHSVGFPACRKQHHNSRNDHPPNVAANPHVEHPGDWCLRHEQLLT